MERPAGGGGSSSSSSNRSGGSQAAQPKAKMNYACEACRSSKVRCLASSQPGTCKRCADSKRECIFRTGPRTRRPKYPQPDAPPRPPPPGPSQTFSIDFRLPEDDQSGADTVPELLDGLRAHHELMIESLVPSPSPPPASCSAGMGEGGDSTTNTTTAQPSTSASSSARSGGVVDRSSEVFDFNDLSAATPTTTNTSSSSTASATTAAAATATAPRSGINSNRSRAGGSGRPLGSLGITPQFNLDSAERLLSTFRDTMLPHCPSIALLSPGNGNGTDVRSLARDSPFVLLAILAVASCSAASPQGHGLYDEEFRKVLGLKFVTASERSLEMLQGLLIYCAWYPFHLRSKQSFKYLRMVVDIVQDLELDQENDYDYGPFWNSQERLREIRTFLACYYNISCYSCSWDKPAIMKYDAWMARCCDNLEQASTLDQDRALVWLVRLQHITAEANELNRSCRAATASRDGKSSGGRGETPSEHHQRIIRLGLEGQLREWQNAIPEQLARMPSIAMASLFAELHLAAAPLVFMRRHYGSNTGGTSKTNKSAHNRTGGPLAAVASAGSTVDPDKLLAAMRPLRALLEVAAALSEGERSGLCGADWGRIVIAIIVGFRCSFPLPLAVLSRPGFDWARARQILDLGAAMEKLIEEHRGGDSDTVGEPKIGESREASSNGKKFDTSVSTMLRVVLRSVKAKYDTKVAAFDAAAAAAAVSSMEEQSRVGIELCPMFNGTLSQYLSTWEGQQQGGGGSGLGIGPEVAGGAFGFAGSSSHDAVSQSGASSGDFSGSTLATDFLDVQPPPLQDLWGAMTTGWAADTPSLDLPGAETLYGEYLDL